MLEPWRETRDGVVLTCRLTPKGGRSAIEGVSHLADGTSVLLARVREPPEGGRANRALCALIADELSVAPSQVRLSSGAKSRLKLVMVSGDPEALVGRLRTL